MIIFEYIKKKYFFMIKKFMIIFELNKKESFFMIFTESFRLSKKKNSLRRNYAYDTNF